MADEPTAQQIEEAPPAGQESKPAEPVEDPAALLRSNRKKDRENLKLKKRIEELEAQNKSDTEKAIDAARKEGRKEAEKEYAARLLSERVRTRAATKGAADPADVLALIDLEGLTIEDDSGIDGRIDELFEAKPYLAGKPGNGKAPSIDQGARGKVPNPPNEEATGNDWLRKEIARRSGIGG